MKASTIGMTLAALVTACACASANAAHVGVFIGGGVPYYYPVAPAPYYYAPAYPAVVAVPADAPPVYVERAQEQAPAGAQAAAGAPSAPAWYYCDASQAYYPNVKECAAGWRPVAPQPSPSN